MKLGITTIKRAVRYLLFAPSLPGIPVETRYSWRNVVRANLPASTIPFPGFARSVRRVEENGIGYDTQKLERILLEANPELRYDQFGNERGLRSLGKPEFPDLLYAGKEINVRKTLAATRTPEERANLAYLLAESTRVTRSIIDGRSLIGYYSSRLPALPSGVVDEALQFFFESGAQGALGGCGSTGSVSWIKGTLLAERVKRYGAASTMAQSMPQPYAVTSELLYLAGREDIAIGYRLNGGASPEEVDHWLRSNLELGPARKYLAEKK